MAPPMTRRWAGRVEHETCPPIASSDHLQRLKTTAGVLARSRVAVGRCDETTQHFVESNSSTRLCGTCCRTGLSEARVKGRVRVELGSNTAGIASVRRHHQPTLAPPRHATIAGRHAQAHTIWLRLGGGPQAWTRLMEAGVVIIQADPPRNQGPFTLV